MDIGPVEILYNWQSLLLALAVSGFIQGIKRVLNYVYGSEDKRKSVRWLTELVLPSLPILLGALAAIVIPLHPDKLTGYIDTHPYAKAWIVFGAWGAAIGQFSDYLYQRVMSAMIALSKSNNSSATEPTPVVDPPATTG